MARTTTAQRQQAPQQQTPQQAPAPQLPANTEQKAHPLVQLKEQVAARAAEFEFALPQHIPVARFMRVVITAVQNNLELLACDRASFFNACLRAAQDGLLPDGREGAIVAYKDRKTGKLLAQWMPMYQGILKKVRNSGELKWTTAQVVYEGDDFVHWIDDTGEHFEHRPAGKSEKPFRIYSAATTLEGACYIEVMTVAQVKRVQAVSRAKSEYGPWAQWWDEMAKKTAFRRLSKRLPLSSDLDDLIRRDDALYDFEAMKEEGAAVTQQRRLSSTAASFDAFANAAPVIEHNQDDGDSWDEETGELDQQDDGTADQRQAGGGDAVEDRPKQAEQAPPPKASTSQQRQQKTEPPKDEAKPEASEAAEQRGTTDQSVGEEVRRWPPGAVPSTADEYEHYLETKLSDFQKQGEIKPWFTSKEEVELREACGVTNEQKNDFQQKAVARLNELSKKAAGRG